MKIKNRLILFEILIMIKILTVNSTNTIASRVNNNNNNSSFDNFKFQTSKISKKQNEFLSYTLNKVHNNNTNINNLNSNNFNKKMDTKKLLSISPEVLDKPNFSVLASNLLGEVRKQIDNNKKTIKQQQQQQKHKQINPQGRVSLSSFDLADKNRANGSRSTPSQKFGNYKSLKNYNETDRNNDTNEDLILKKQLIQLNDNHEQQTSMLLDNVQISYIEFDFLVNDFNNFEPKTGMISIDAKLKYKWWNKNANKLNNVEQQAQAQRYQSFSLKNPINKSINKSYEKNEAADDSLPKIEFKNKNLVKFKINNQLQKIENYEEFTSEKAENAFNFTAQKLSSSSQNSARTKSSIDGFKKQNKNFLYLEQSVSLKFKCKNFLDSESDEVDSEDEEGIDVSQFPFDVHRCSLEFDIIPSSKNNSSNLTTIYMFPNLKDFNQIDYFKLVKQITNNSLFAQEWVLKRLYINYFNSTSTLNYMSNHVNFNKNNNNNNINMELNNTSNSINSISDFMTTESEDSFPINDYIMSLNLNGELVKKKRNDNDDQQLKNSFLNNITPAKVSIDFLVYRRREPQIYLFVLPLVILTLITFLIFFLPTTKGSEKSLIALLNCAFLIAYNIYAFKMIVLTYDISKIPLILKYSNCLMIIQLAVLAYTCLVKSIYLNGFLTFSSRTYMNASEELYNQILYSNQTNNKCSSNSNNERNIINNDFDTDLHKKCDPLSTSMHQQTYCVSKAAAAHCHSSQSLLKTGDVIGKSIEQINGFGIIAPSINNQTCTTLGGTVGDESNYTVYNNIDHPCDCSTNDGEQINGTRDDNFCCEDALVHENNNNKDIIINNVINNNSNVNSNGIDSENENKNEYGMILDYNKSNNNQSDANKNSKPNLFFTIFCCASGLFEKLKNKNFCNDDKRVADCVGDTLEYDYASHLSRNIKLPTNTQIATFKQINSSNKTECTNKQGLPFSMQNNDNNSMQPQLPTLSNKYQLIDYPVYTLNTHLKQLVKFEELHLREKLIKEEWKRKARFCDGICCLFIFFILVTCSICIFAVLPTVKISSMVD